MNEPCSIKQEDTEQQIDLKKDNEKIEELFKAVKDHDDVKSEEKSLSPSLQSTAKGNEAVCV